MHVCTACMIVSLLTTCMNFNKIKEKTTKNNEKIYFLRTLLFEQNEEVKKTKNQEKSKTLHPESRTPPFRRLTCVKTYESVTNVSLCGKKIHGAKKWVRHGPIFRPARKVGDVQDWQVMCLSTAVCHLGCSVLALHSGPSRSPTLGGAVASSRQQTMGSKELQARRRPVADPPKVNSNQKRAHPTPIKK